MPFAVVLRQPIHRPRHTSPLMTEILSAKAAFYHIEQIIKQARERIILVSPYLRIPQIIRDRLREAAQRGVEITVVSRDVEKPEEKSERDYLLALPRLSLYTLSYLHAKCYLNEQQLVITSLNLYEFSERNWEMGVRFTADEPAYADAKQEVDSIVAAATLFSGPSRGVKPGVSMKPAPTPKPLAMPKSKGFCIRCVAPVALNPAARLCRDCWTVWVVFENEEYPEKFCHECGRKADTSKARPRCERCFRKSATALR